MSVLDGLMNHKGSETTVDYFGVGVGNFGTSQFEHEDRPGHLAEGLRAEYFSNINVIRRTASSTASINESTLIGRAPILCVAVCRHNLPCDGPA